MEKGKDKREKSKKIIAKKLIILYILKALEDFPPCMPLSYTTVTKVLNGIGVQCDRKTVSRNIGYLIEFGVPIKKLGNGIFYFRNDTEYKKLLEDVKFDWKN